MFDFLVIGGGIQGAAIAREVALRGSTVLLVEKDDFGCETSSKSSRLIHGGLRYLQHGHLSLVREALHERERLLRLAPHLVRPCPMLMPFFRGGSKRPWLVKIGLKLYGLLAGDHSLPAARGHAPEDCRRLFPGLRGRDLLGGTLFYDARTEDQRLTMAVVEDAYEAGALVANHLPVFAAKEGEVHLRDEPTDATVRVRARTIINAAGPGVDGVRRLLGIQGPNLVRLSRGSHLVLHPMETEVSLAAFLPDGRIQFVIPKSDGTVCGTTEVDDSQPEDGAGVAVPREDITYVLDALGYLLEQPPGPADVRTVYGAWRALPVGKGPAGGLNREAFLCREDSVAGPVHTVVGGKLTTHRSFAERSVNGILGLRSGSPSRDRPLPGGGGPQEFADDLWWRHGDRSQRVRAIATEREDLAQPICSHRALLRAEAVYALRHQATMTFADLMLRRLFHTQGPCLRDACLLNAHELFAEFAANGAVTSGADIAGLKAKVRHAEGELHS